MTDRPPSDASVFEQAAQARRAKQRRVLDALGHVGAEADDEPSEAGEHERPEPRPA